MTDKTAYAQHDAGVLKNDKLAAGAKLKFIQDVKQEMILGTDALPPSPLPCGPSFPPIPFADRIELEDEEQYPGFHENILGMYEQIAIALDVQSQFMFAPVVMDPVALAVKLGLDVPSLRFPDEFLIYSFGLPLLAIKLGFNIPIELAAKLPTIIVPSPPIPKLPLPVDIQIPQFQQLFDFSLWPLKIPDLFINLITKIPNLLLDIIQFDFGAICEAVLASKLFGDVSPDSVVQAVSAKVLARKTAECIVIALVGGSVGSSSGGIVGALGQHFGYDPPPGPETKEQNVRDRIVDAANSMDGQSWSKDKRALADAGGIFKNANLKYTGFLLPVTLGNGDPKDTQNAYFRAAGFSSCGLFVRGCYFRGGATDRYFTTEYQDSTAISGLIGVGERKGAVVPFSRNEMPALKKGDAILVRNRNQANSEHVLMLTTDYSGGLDGEVEGIEGGQTDVENKNRPTAIKRTKYRFFTSGGRLSAGRPGIPGDAREIVKIFDAEKMSSNA